MRANTGSMIKGLTPGRGVSVGLGAHYGGWMSKDILLQQFAWGLAWLRRRKTFSL